MNSSNTSIVRTANNKTNAYAVPGRRTTQWLVETVVTLSCPAGLLYSEVDARTAAVRKLFKLSGANKFSHPLTIQGLHYPGAEFPIPGYRNDRFRPYPSSITLIGTKNAMLLTRDARCG